MQRCLNWLTGIAELENVNETTTKVCVFPEPFSRIVHFNINPINSASVTLKIYDVNGRSLYHFTSTVSSKNCNLTWCGIDQTGKSLSSGIYFYQISFNKINPNQSPDFIGRLTYLK
jgi:flagellar hook assembly protein FlgD